MLYNIENKRREVKVMKKRTIKLTSLFLILIVMLSLCLSSCGVLRTVQAIIDIYGFPQEEFPFEEEIEGEYGEMFPDNAEDPLDIPNGGTEELPKDNFTDSEIIIEGSNNITAAAAVGLRSAVSVESEFSSGSSWGSGVIYKLDASTGSAFIITNYHVVYYSNGFSGGAISSNISVFLFGMEYEEYAIPATFVGGSPNYDIAVLRVNNSELLKTAAAAGAAASVMLGNSDNVMAGTTAIAIGNPEASGISVTSGIVSIDSEYISMSSINGSGQVEFRVIRIDTAVNSGNSGGGLFGDNGKLIGIVNAKITKTDVENIGYAIPVNVARAIADNIIDYCYGKSCNTVMRALLGVTVTADNFYTEYDEESGAIRQYEQVTVVEVSETGIAHGIILADDIIKSVKIGERTVEVTRRHHLIDAMLDARVGDTVYTTVIRDGVEKTVEIVITEDCLAAY